jgi:SAM-dependent methyltransferase
MTVPKRARSLLRRWVRSSTGWLGDEQDLGDFARRAPRRDAAGRCAYEALAAGLLQSRLEGLAGAGAIVTPDHGRLTGPALGEETHVVRVATGDAAAELQRLDERFGGSQLDWVVVDRCLQFVHDIPPALAHVVGWLKPGGTLISLFAGLGRTEPEARRPLWIVLPYAARRLHEECAALGSIEVEQRGNVALALAWLYGLGAEELTHAELQSVDRAYPVLVAAIAARRGVALEAEG